MQTIMLGLLVVSLLLIVISFFMKDSVKELKNEVDQLSLNQIQELYQMKRKIKILEEELLVNDTTFTTGTPVKDIPVKKPQREIHAIIKNQVWSLAQQGVSVDQIAKQSSLPLEDVEMIVNEFSMKGEQYE